MLSRHAFREKIQGSAVLSSALFNVTPPMGNDRDIPLDVHGTLEDLPTFGRQERVVSQRLETLPR